MKKTFKTFLALVMAVAMMASLCVTAMAEYPAAFNYVAGNKPNDIVITDGQATVSLKEKQAWPENLDYVDTYAIAENVAYTLFVNGQNYQPIIDAQDVYHFVVFSPICFGVPLCWAEGVNASFAEITIVAFGFPDGSIVDYSVLGPTGNRVMGGKASIKDNIGYPLNANGTGEPDYSDNNNRVILPADLMAGLDDGVYTFVINGKLPGEGDGDGKDYSSTSPFGVKDGKLASALDDALSNGGNKNKNKEINYFSNVDVPAVQPQPVKPAPKPSKGSDLGHGITISDGTYGLGAHINDKREVTLTIGQNNIKFPTSKLVGDFGASTAKGQKSGITFDMPSTSSKKSSSGSVTFDIFNALAKLHK